VSRSWNEENLSFTKGHPLRDARLSLVEGMTHSTRTYGDALHAVSLRGHEEVVKILMDVGAIN